ncbi:cell cycle checkpoint [Fusarium subglutinans]|uniref:Cell cycle checkpoint n=1 Tax=Gibberella subglutinans TaxID=42677 RepID=A0A8H5Q5W0_GIBSU|nr:cell cycle checkpoint [Fusarium subglutinans]KAF5609174.1 cell cycle checkpoint [Fusarium subglutinans]
MDSSLHEVWQAAAGSPFFPTVSKGSQFWVAFFLLFLGFSLTGVFALNRTLVNVPVLGIPASIAIAHNLEMAPDAQPIFRAVATSTRPLYQLLRCINFAPRVHVQITEDGVRFAADHARVMQGVAFLDKALFSSYTANLPAQDGDNPPELPNFQLSLSSVLEVLQIFGAVDVATRAQKADQDPYRSNLRNYRPDAFSNQTLGISGTCTLQYSQEGDPFKITIEESGVKTTASLTTYLPEIPDDIPFDRNDLSFKIIMQSRTLLDSMAEISPTAPTKLTIATTKTSPFLSLAGVGDLGSSGVDFARGRDLLETFNVQERWSQAYKFDFIKNSTEAMRIATKVSLRGDGQGVLSLQFMVDIEGGKRSFLDFRFVPFISHDEEDDENDELEEAGEAD